VYLEYLKGYFIYSEKVPTLLESLQCGSFSGKGLRRNIKMYKG
jgi:hypothetical protein